MQEPVISHNNKIDKFHSVDLNESLFTDIVKGVSVFRLAVFTLRKRLCIVCNILSYSDKYDRRLYFNTLLTL